MGFVLLTIACASVIVLAVGKLQEIERQEKCCTCGEDFDLSCPVDGNN